MADTEVQGGFNHVVEKDMSQARLQAAQQYNAQVQQQRANAPSSLKSGSPEEAQVKAEERQDAQQAFVGGGFNRQGSSKDSFASQREAALSSGKFDYSAVRSASYSPPSNFVNNKGARVSRPSEPIQSVPVPEKIVTKTQLSSSTEQPKILQSTTQVLQPQAKQTSPSISVNPQQSQIQKTQQTINQISSDFTTAKNAGITKIDVLDSSGKVIGSVNPQNVSQARLQYLNLTKQGAVQYQYSIPGKDVTTSSLTNYNALNPLTAFVGGALGGFAELGLVGLGLVAKATGKPITIPGTDYTAQPKGVLIQAQNKVQKTFGQDTLDKIISGQKVDITNPNDLASLAGFGSSIIATGGIGGIKAVSKAPSLISGLLKSSGGIKTSLTKGAEEEGIQNVKVVNVKTSTGVFGPEGTQTRGTAQFGTGGVSSTSSSLSGGGTSSSITPRAIETPNVSTGLIGKTETIGKGTTGIFSGSTREGVSATPDIRNQKLEYISGGISRDKGNTGSVGSKTTTTSKTTYTPQTTLEQIKPIKPYQLTKTTADIIKPESKQLTKTNMRTQIRKESSGLKQDTFGTVSKLSSRNGLVYQVRQEEEQSYLTTPKGFNTPKVQTRQAVISPNISSRISPNPQKTKLPNRPTLGITTALIPRSGFISKPKQTTTTVGITDQITTTVTRGKTPPNIPQNGTPQIPDNKRKLGALIPGINPASGALGKVGKFGSSKGYIGNVPLSSLVGIYNRSEVSYGGSRENLSRSSKTNYSKLGTKGKSPKLI